ncbi:MAG: hypothetical protein ACI9N9_002714 [Enterobacterales bacterium]|jgi:hypothetical protein
MKYLLLISFIIYSTSAHGAKYEYQSINYSKYNSALISKETLTIDTNYLVVSCDEQKRLFGNKKCRGGRPTIKFEDVIHEADICDSDKLKMVCFSGGNTVFSFPLKRPNKGDKWEYEGKEFEVLHDNFRLTMFGRKFNTYVVQSEKIKGKRSVYLYSISLGILAIHYISEIESVEQMKAFYLVSDRGFGSFQDHES